MTIDKAKLPPGPYQLEASATFTNNGHGHLYLVDRHGRKIAALWGKDDEKQALGELIMDARAKIDG